jgi:hypothetical protein
LADWNRFRWPITGSGLSLFIFIVLAWFGEASWSAALIGFALTAGLIIYATFPAAPPTLQGSIPQQGSMSDNRVI